MKGRKNRKIRLTIIAKKRAFIKGTGSKSPKAENTAQKLFLLDLAKDGVIT